MPERTGHSHHSVPETDTKRAASSPEIRKEETRNESQGILNRGAKDVPFYTPEQVPPAGTALDPQPNGQPIPKLFTPLKIRDMAMQNRIMVSPMCQYSADKGKHTPWHTTHLGGIVQRGPGLTMVEATAVQANGRITPEDSGLWNELQVEPLRAHVEFAHSQGQKIGIQLGHAGRKASTVAPWLASAALATADVGGWPDDVVAPSAGAYNEAHATPRALSLGEIEGIKRDFIAAAARAIKCGFDALELHAAHGYLLHEFLSPATNRRTDEYGGAFEHRIRLLLEIVNETRKIMPVTMPLFVRVSATDWLEDADDYEGESWTVADMIRLAEQLAGRGVDVIDVSSGGLDPRQKITPGPGYQAPFAKAIKKALGNKILVATVGGITSGRQADELLVGSGASGNDEPLDIIVAGRGFQKDPSLVWSWADELDTSIYLASQIGWGFGGRSSRTSKAT